MSPRSHRPLSAIVLLAAFCFACGSDDDPPSSGSQADAAMLPIDAALPHPTRSRSMQVPTQRLPRETTSRAARPSRMTACATCTARSLSPADALASQRRCEAILDGFTEECGQCFVFGTNPGGFGDILLGGGEYCHGAISYYLPYCTAECDGNDELTTALDRVAKCDGLCEPINGHAPDVGCASDVQSACRLECRDRFEGLSSRCAACMVALSYPPQVYPTEKGLACSREVWAPTADCAAYCP